MEAQKRHYFFLVFLIYRVSYLFLSHTHTHARTHTNTHVCKVLPCLADGATLFAERLCLQVNSVLSAQLIGPAAFTLRYVKLSPVSSFPWDTHTHTHKCTNSKGNVGSSLNIHTQHIFMKWHLCVCMKQGCPWPQASPCGFQVASPSVSLSRPLPACRSPSVVSFPLFLTSFCLLSRWYISCSWHGSCIAYG